MFGTKSGENVIILLYDKEFTEVIEQKGRSPTSCNPDTQPFVKDSSCKMESEFLLLGFWKRLNDCIGP